MKRKIKKISLLACFLLMIATFVSAIAACSGSRKPTATAYYYLSCESESWQTYDSKDAVPEKYLFTQSGDNYILNIELNEDEQFTVNEGSSSEKFGYSALFTALDKLVSGDSGSLKVAESGTYALTFSASEETLTYTFTPEEEEVTLVSLSITYSVPQMYTGDSYTFTASAFYSDGTSPAVLPDWSSDNEAVATVSEDGTVTAIGAGTATVTAEYGSFSASVTVTVIKPAVSVSGVTLSQTELALERYATAQLTATVLPSDADNQAVFYSSSDTSVATVSSEGVVTAVAYGTAKITVTTANGGKTADCTVTVVQHVTGLKLSATALTLVVGGSARECSVSFLPSGATYQTFDWEVTEGEDYISVTAENGVLYVSGLAEGSATIVVFSTDNPEATAACTVTVLASGTKIASLPQSLQVMLEEEATLSLSFDNLTEDGVESVSWSTQYEAVATVSGEDDGLTATVTGASFGTTAVTAVVTDTEGNTYTATCTVLVADSFYFVYGYGFGAYDWDYTDYVGDENAARDADILLEEVSTGVYALTRHLTTSNGFQIIFPNVASFTDEEGTWNMDIKYPSVYYDASRSDTAYISNSDDYFGVNAAGYYTITLDLTGSQAWVYVKLVSLDVTSVRLSLAEGSYVLRNGDKIVFLSSVTPSAATYTEGDIEYYLSAEQDGAADCAGISFDISSMRLSVNVIGSVTEETVLTVHFLVTGVEYTVEVIVLPDDAEESPVTSIAFEEDAYYVNVNQGGASGAWETTVTAYVNSDATNQQVRYYDITDYTFINTLSVTLRPTLDTETGEITACVLGTITVQAVALGDESVTATCTVTFFSNVLYLIGVRSNYTALSETQTTVEGTSFEDYQLTQISYTHYRITYTNSNTTSSDGDRFQIAFCGMDSTTWLNVISASNVAQSLCNITLGWNSDYYFYGQNIQLRSANATYIIDVDLSRHMPLVTLNFEKNDFNGAVLDYDESETSVGLGESAVISVYSIPPNVTDITYSVSGNENGYVSAEYDETERTVTVTVVSVEHSEDMSVVLTVTVCGKQKLSVTITVLAEHHLEQTWDDTSHWYQCTDEGCDHTEGLEKHSKLSDLVCTDARGHYYVCEGCGIEFDFEAHTCTVSGAAAGSETCDVCGFAFFEKSGTTLTAYYGTFTSVNLYNSGLTAIGDYAFDGSTALKTLYLPITLTSIGDYAFRDCTSLTKIQLPNSVASIGKYAFYNVSATVTFGSSAVITEIGSYAFAYYMGTGITLPDTVTKIGNGAFAYSAITSIVVPDKVNTETNTSNLGIGVFTGCLALTYVELGTGITVLNDTSFSGCTALEEVWCKSTKFWHINASAFSGCTSLKAVYISRPLSELITAISVGSGNTLLQGCIYAYSESSPGGNPDYGSYADYFAGTWHYDNSGDQEYENIVLWSDEATT